MRKRKLQSWKTDLVENLELPKDLMHGAVMVSIVGRTEMTIENYRGILEYSSEEIRLSTKDGTLSIQGKKLLITYYTNDDMKITGIIQSIVYGV